MDPNVKEVVCPTLWATNISRPIVWALTCLPASLVLRVATLVADGERGGFGWAWSAPIHSVKSASDTWHAILHLRVPFLEGSPFVWF